MRLAFALHGIDKRHTIALSLVEAERPTVDSPTVESHSWRKLSTSSKVTEIMWGRIGMQSRVQFGFT